MYFIAIALMNFVLTHFLLSLIMPIPPYKSRKQALKWGLLSLFALGFVTATLENSGVADGNRAWWASVKAESEARRSAEAEEAAAEAEEAARPENQIRRLMESTFGSDLRDVQVVEQVTGGYSVFVAFNADGLTANMARFGIEENMKSAYKALYTSDVDVNVASVAAYGPVVDRFGNVSETVVYKTTLEAEVGDRVNWDMYLNLEWDKLWTVSRLNRSFRES